MPYTVIGLVLSDEHGNNFIAPFDRFIVQPEELEPEEAGADAFHSEMMRRTAIYDTMADLRETAPEQALRYGEKPTKQEVRENIGLLRLLGFPKPAAVDRNLERRSTAGSTLSEILKRAMTEKRHDDALSKLNAQARFGGGIYGSTTLFVITDD